MKIIIATNNENKVRELKKIFNNYELLSLNDVNINIDVEENGKTFQENARIKAKAIYDLTKLPVIADDSGVILDELKDWPGINTKRISKNDNSHERNQLLIDKSKELKNKSITAICALVYIDELGELTTQGEMHGTITNQEFEGNGFGFDSIFRLNDGRVVSKLTPNQKNKLSHRYQAALQMKKLLQKNRSNNKKDKC